MSKAKDAKDASAAKAEARATAPLHLEVHMLRSYPPSNLNRDDLGTPKTALFGGVRRLRISSQCLKRTWRRSAHFTAGFEAEELGVRTQLLPRLVTEALKAQRLELKKAEYEGLLNLLGKLGKKATKQDDPSQDEEEEAAEAPTEASAQALEAASGGSDKTAHLLYLSRSEIAAVATFADAQREQLAAFTAKKPPPKLEETLRAALKEALHKTVALRPVDVSLFGRFLTSDEFASVDASMQVAHALGTQPVELESDYFTAMDDETNEAGAGHLGETEFAASVLYHYGVVDVRSLRSNLAAGGAPSNAHDAVLAKALPALFAAMTREAPTGKKNGTAPQTPADYLEVVVRRDAPVSLANAFLRPVRPQGGKDVMDRSIEALRAQAAKYEEAYGTEGAVLGRFVLCLRDELEHAPPKEQQVASVAALGAAVHAAVAQALASGGAA